MPQYELEHASGESRILRARSVEDAAARAGMDGASVAPEADVQGWREITAASEVVGKVREHNRMRFRRD